MTANMAFSSIWLAASIGSGRLRRRRPVAAQQEGAGLAMEGGAHDLEMHEMRGAVDLDVALDRRGLEGIEQPACILVRHEAVPFPPDHRDGRLHQTGVVGERAVPGALDVADWAGGDLDARRVPRPAGRVAV